MPLTVQEFLSKKPQGAPVEVFKLSDGDEVYLRRMTAKIYRDYRKDLRDKSGVPIPERQAYGDEILAAHLLCDQSGNRGVTTDQVLAGCFDELLMLPLGDVIRRGYEMIGITDPEDDEDREKNSSTTDSTEQS